MASSSSSSFFYIEPLRTGETSRHYSLNTCSLCGKLIAGDCDILMYRGDAPFCSEECRCHEILRDELASAKDHLASKEQQHHRHETPAAESGRVKLAADVPVAT